MSEDSYLGWHLLEDAVPLRCNAEIWYDSKMYCQTTWKSWMFKHSIVDRSRHAHLPQLQFRW